MRGYAVRKGDRWYAVVPVTGREKRSWHSAGTTREEADGACLTNMWLPGKRINLAQSTWDGYRRKIERHILPAIGHLRIRRLRAQHLEIGQPSRSA